MKVSCLGPTEGLQIGGAKDTLEAAEGQMVAEEVAAAASAAISTTDQGLKVYHSPFEKDALSLSCSFF